MELNYYNKEYIDAARLLYDDKSYNTIAKKYFYFQRYNLLAGYRFIVGRAISTKMLIEVKHYYDTYVKSNTYDNLNLDEKIYNTILLNNF